MCFAHVFALEVKCKDPCGAADDTFCSEALWLAAGALQ